MLLGDAFGRAAWYGRLASLAEALVASAKRSGAQVPVGGAENAGAFAVVRCSAVGGRVNGAVSEPHTRLPKPVPVEAEPESFRQRQLLARRHTRRLHAVRMGDRVLPWQEPEEERCSECGTEIDNYTSDCGTCWERRRGRSRRSTASTAAQ